MNYFKIPILFIVLIFLLDGCGNSNDAEKIKANDYSGYIEDASGAYMFANVLINDSVSIMKTSNVNDEDIIYTGKFNSENTSATFNNISCTQSKDNLVCDGFILTPTEINSTIDKSSLDGTYKTADSLNNIWTMDILSGVVNIYNDTNACRLTGVVDVNKLPYFDMTANGCASDGNYLGYAQLDSLYQTNDTINLVVPNFSNITNSWTK
ncbi:MAG: hypothetical protein ACNI25_10560 [Halarcobacter sp.]